MIWSLQVLVRLFRIKGAVVSAGVLLTLILASVFAPLLSPHDPLEQNFLRRLAPPSREHPMGTDALGRDVFSRVLYGGRVSLLVAFTSVLLALAVAIPLGLFSAMAKGWVDTLTMRVVDALLCFPAILLGLVMAAIFPPGLYNIILVIALVYIPRLLRFVRGQGLAVVNQLYVEAAVAIGVGPLRLLFQHILPAVIPAVVVQASVNLGHVVLIEAALSFLGVGVQPPQPTWGGILRHGMSYIGVAPWIIVLPGLVLSLLILSVNVLGDMIRDAHDPRLRL